MVSSSLHQKQIPLEVPRMLRRVALTALTAIFVVSCAAEPEPVEPPAVEPQAAEPQAPEWQVRIDEERERHRP